MKPTKPLPVHAPVTGTRRAGPREHGCQTARSTWNRPKRAGVAPQTSHMHAAAGGELDPSRETPHSPRMAYHTVRTRRVW
jgi:hypothetical protein